MSSDHASRELKWFALIMIGLGIVWIASGGLKSLTKNNPFIKPAQPLNTGETYGKGSSWLNFLIPNFSTVQVGNNNNNLSQTNKPSPTSNKPTNNTTLYGADKPPGPIVETPDSLSITSVRASRDTQGKVGSEYVKITAEKTNKNKILLSGMLLKSRMTGNQADIRQGVSIYYANSLNQEEPIYLAPGKTAYVISGRSPLGYSFTLNQCIGYLGGNQDYVVGISSNCPGILSYPLPARPNAVSDKCLDFLNSVPTCTSDIIFPSTLDYTCRNFVVERMNYTRCVADFKNNKDFLSGEWRIYLSRNESLWKKSREIVDLLDQKGNIVSTYTY